MQNNVATSWQDRSVINVREKKEKRGMQEEKRERSRERSSVEGAAGKCGGSREGKTQEERGENFSGDEPRGGGLG
jgi:hypothetical protein